MLVNKAETSCLTLAHLPHADRYSALLMLQVLSAQFEVTSMNIPATPVALCAHHAITQASFARKTTTMKGELRVRQTTIGKNTCGWIDGNPGER